MYDRQHLTDNNIIIAEGKVDRPLIINRVIKERESFTGKVYAYFQAASTTNFPDQLHRNPGQLNTDIKQSYKYIDKRIKTLYP